MRITALAIIVLTGFSLQPFSFGNFPSQTCTINPVGMTTRNFLDSSRSNWLGNEPRPIRIEVWYPAEINSGKEETLTDQNQFREPVKANMDGHIAPQLKKYPLILISHGSYGNAAQMRWLGFYLAAHGFIAVVLNHNGTPEEEKQMGQLTISELCMWERPRDISVALDKMLQDPDFGADIDRDRIGAAGFSLGGATAIWTAGAILNMDTLKVNAPRLPPQMMQMIQEQVEMTKEDTLVRESFSRAQNSYRDDRIRAIFALAPAIGFGFTREGLKGIKVPVQIVVGDRDIIAPLSVNAKRYSQFIRNAKLIILPGERGHYTQPAPGNEHAVELEEVSRIALQFFQKELY